MSCFDCAFCEEACANFCRESESGFRLIADEFGEIINSDPCSKFREKRKITKEAIDGQFGIEIDR